MTNWIAASIAMLKPEVVVFVSACIVLIGDLFTKKEPGSNSARNLWSGFALAGLVVALLTTVQATVVPPKDSLPVSLFNVDTLAQGIRYLAIGSGMVLVLISWRSLPNELAGELVSSMLFLVMGVQLVGLANDLVTLFLALELVSIPTYVLLTLWKRDNAGYESSIKYFLLSIFSSAIFLFGLSYFYGAVGSTNLTVIANAFSATSSSGSGLPNIMLIAFLLVFAGLGFRVTAVPFHFYAPDVFAGTSTNLAAMLSQMPKLAGFAGLVRIFSLFAPSEFSVASRGVPEQAIVLLWAIALVTMVVGNTLALQQTSLRRLLAYSSVSHAGYMLVALATLRSGDNSTVANVVQVLLYYLTAYGAMTMGFFAVINAVESSGRRIELTTDLDGLFEKNRGMAFLAALFLFSLMGLPPTAGFIGKLSIFFAAWQEGTTSFQMLAVLMALNAASVHGTT